MASRIRRLHVAALVVLLLLLAQVVGDSWVTQTYGWRFSGLPVFLNLGSLGASWRSGAIDSLREWNRAAGRSMFSWSSTNRALGCGENGRNDVYWSNTQCGGTWGGADGTITQAITRFWHRDQLVYEADVVFNNTLEWDIYSGPLRSSVRHEFRRVALHEFGHVLGLAHPDDHGQSVAAVMNSRSSDIDSLQQDDIDGLQFLYGLNGGDPGRRPDLVVESLVVSGGGPVTTGRRFTLVATVRNIGTGRAEAVGLRYFYWQASRSEWVVVGYDNLPSLGRRESTRQSVRLTAPSRRGRHWYRACAPRVTAERRWSAGPGENCSRNLRVDVRAGAGGNPDLVVRNARVSNSSPTTGQQFRLFSRVANVGTARSPSTRLWHWQRPAGGSWSRMADSQVVGAISANRYRSFSRLLTAPSRPGAYEYAVCVERVRGEPGSGSNCDRVRITVRGGSAPPDLVVRNGRVSDRSPVAGQRFRLYADVHNIGGSTSESTRLRYWQRPRGGAWERVGDNDYVPALAPRRRVAYSTLLTAQLGTHEYTACVRRVAGEPAGSNCLSSVLTVTGGRSDAEYEITIDNARFDRSEAFEEEGGGTHWQYWVEVTATNTGRRALVPDYAGDFSGNPAFLWPAFWDRNGNLLGTSLGDVYMGSAPWSPGEQRRGFVWGFVYSHERSSVHSYTLGVDSDVACVGCEARPVLVDAVGDGLLGPEPDSADPMQE